MGRERHRQLPRHYLPTWQVGPPLTPFGFFSPKIVVGWPPKSYQWPSIGFPLATYLLYALKSTYTQYSTFFCLLQFKNFRENEITVRFPFGGYRQETGWLAYLLRPHRQFDAPPTKEIPWCKAQCSATKPTPLPEYKIAIDGNRYVNNVSKRPILPPSSHQIRGALEGGQGQVGSSHFSKKILNSNPIWYYCSFFTSLQNRLYSSHISKVKKVVQYSNF